MSQGLRETLIGELNSPLEFVPPVAIGKSEQVPLAPEAPMEQYPLRSELRPDTDLDPPRRRCLRAAESERTLSLGPPGDLYVYLDIEEIPEIQRDGINLNSSISVSYLDAILGTIMKGINLRETIIGKLNSPLESVPSVAIGKSEQVPLAPEAPMEQYPLRSELRPYTDLDPPRRRRLRAAESERTLSSSKSP
ncbi:hypothetical protein CASFOL_006646 [Castilleja foliolosa]|uniref:Chaperone DnaJ C-terminal domain-containing protein n=1 Tax=Castilleja foliolosa TaxID=1961234 RepID=A0ABD3E6Z2_9LAMI